MLLLRLIKLRQKKVLQVLKGNFWVLVRQFPVATDTAAELPPLLIPKQSCNDGITVVFHVWCPDTRFLIARYLGVRKPLLPPLSWLVLATEASSG